MRIYLHETMNIIAIRWIRWCWIGKGGRNKKSVKEGNEENCTVNKKYARKEPVGEINVHAIFFAL